MPATHLTKCEVEVMNVVWSRGKATVQDVVDALERTLAYTTVMTTLKILEGKRKVLKKTKQGRAFVYEPVVSRKDVSRAMADDLTRNLFGGSAKSLVLSLIDGDALSAADIAELKHAIRQLEDKA